MTPLSLSTLRRTISLAGMIGIAILVLGADGSAQDPSDRELRAARERLHAIHQKAERAHEQGRLAEARELRAEADELARRLELRHARDQADEERRHHLEQQEEQRRADERARDSDRAAEREELASILNDLERGMRALRRLGREEELHMLRRVAEEVAAERREQRPDRDDHLGDERRARLRAQMEVLHFARAPIAESDDERLVEFVEKSIRRRKNLLEGPSEDAEHGLEHGRGNEIEVLIHASQLWDEYGVHDKAERLRDLVQRFWDFELPRERENARRHREEDETRAHDREREAAHRRLQIMRHAVEAYLEIGNEEAAHLVELAMHARELRLEGRRDDEALEIMESSPGDEQLAQLLHYAGRMYSEWGKEDRAHALDQLHRDIAGRAHGQHREDASPREREDELRRHLHDAFGRIHELEDRLARLEEIVQELRRRRSPW